MKISHPVNPLERHSISQYFSICYCGDILKIVLMKEVLHRYMICYVHSSTHNPAKGSFDFGSTT